MGKVLGYGLLYSVIGFLVGIGVGVIVTGSNVRLPLEGDQGSKVVLALFMVSGWGAGGVIGALAGIGSILESLPKHLPR